MHSPALRSTALVSVLKTACIYCFSGTGNTLLATQRLMAGLHERGVETSCHALSPDGQVQPGTSGLGLTFPVACQSTYPFVWDFIARLPPGDGRAVFVMDTLHAFSGGLLAPLRRLLVGKGYEPLGAIEVKMPSNLRLREPGEAKVAATAEKAMASVDRFAEQLAEGRAEWPRAGMFEGVLHTVSRSRLLWAFARWLMGLRHDPGHCSDCGFCQSICPMRAIDPERMPVLDRKACQLCMRCYSYCPVGSIRSRLPWQPYRAVKVGELLALQDTPTAGDNETGSLP